MYTQTVYYILPAFGFMLQAAPTQDNLNALQHAIDSMEEKGMQEDPRYSQLLAIRARQNNMEPPRLPGSVSCQSRKMLSDQVLFFRENQPAVSI